MFPTIKQRLKRAYYASLGIRIDAPIPFQTVNPGDQAWYFAERSLQQGNIVYSLGLATNIDFDLNLIKAFGVEVHGFDPTPDSVEWLNEQVLPSQFHLHPVAIAGHDGELIFELPTKAGQCARAVEVDQPASGESASPTPTGKVTVPCRRISTLMKELNHSRVDCLKMDIEGSEYEVIDDILTNRLDVRQILVEFHHRFEGIGMQKTITAIAALRKAGYQLFHISPWCEEFAFLKKPGV